MKLIIHDLENKELKELFPSVNEDMIILNKNEKISKCIGCFGCWIKTPASCVIKDSYMDMGKLIAQSDDIIIISKCFYGGFSPYIKNVLDRSISYVLPYFSMRNGEMHHKSRYSKQGQLSVYIYGEDITTEESDTAAALYTANSINLNMKKKNFKIFNTIPEMKGELKWI